MRLSEAVAEFHRGYFSTHRRSPHTQQAYAIDLDQFLAWLGAGRLLASVTPDDLEHWAAELKGRDYASSSIRRKFATLRVFLSYWVRKGALERSPLWMIRLDLAPQRTLTKVLTVDEMRRLLEEAHRQAIRLECRCGVDPAAKTFVALRNVAVLEILFATGLRVGELVALQLGDYQESESSFLVKGKGSRERMAFLPDRRSRSAVQRYFSARTQVRIPHSKFFVNTKGRALAAQGVASVLARTAAGAGLSKRITPHMIRHTVATFLMRNGANIRVVQEFLGHSSIAVTERYTRVCHEDLQTALALHHPNRARSSASAFVSLNN